MRSLLKAASLTQAMAESSTLDQCLKISSLCVHHLAMGQVPTLPGQNACWTLSLGAPPGMLLARTSVMGVQWLQGRSMGSRASAHRSYCVVCIEASSAALLAMLDVRWLRCRALSLAWLKGNCRITVTLQPGTGSAHYAGSGGLAL